MHSNDPFEQLKLIADDTRRRLLLTLRGSDYQVGDHLLMLATPEALAALEALAEQAGLNLGQRPDHETVTRHRLAAHADATSDPNRARSH